MTRTHVFAVAAACATLVAVSRVDAQGRRGNRNTTPDREQKSEAKSFEWSGELAEGQRFVLRSLNGSVSVERGSGRTLEVVASKRWRRGEPSEVKIDATRIKDGVLVCARWTANTVCDANRYSMSSDEGWARKNDIEVVFTIKLPTGTTASLNTTNGSIEVLGTSSTIEALTTNGEIVIEASEGPTKAHTTNGDIDVRMTKVPSTGASYRTTNGSITVSLPDGVGANVEARTTLGRVQLDFPVTASGSMSPHRVVGTIGKGGPLLDISTTLGSVRIEKK